MFSSSSLMFTVQIQLIYLHASLIFHGLLHVFRRASSKCKKTVPDRFIQNHIGLWLSC